MRKVFLSKNIITAISLIGVLFLSSTSVFSQTEADSIWTFSKVRTDATGDNELDFYGKQVTVTGIANISSGLLHEYYLQAFIQNDTAGMSIFAYDIQTPFKVGDSLVVQGKIEQYDGLTEIHLESYQVYKNAANESATTMLSSAVVDPVQYLGMLIEGEGRIIEKGSTFNGKFVRVRPANSSESMMVYVSNFHRLFDDFHFGILSVGDKIYIKGVISESNPDFPNERVFKLFLRTPDDLRYSGLPKIYLYIIFGVVVLFGLIITIWVILLRRKVTSKTTEIRTSLQEKEILLREIHHRVKNSLSIVSGLIELQQFETENTEAKNVLQSSKSRIQSVALIHDKLYRTESLARVELDIYIRDLAETIHETFTEYKDAVELLFDLDSIELDTDRVIPCGLLINELLVNAYKHAFKKEKQGRLTIRLKNQGEHILLQVSDNGPGLSEHFDKEKEGNLGTKLIKSFTDKLNATMEVSESNQGTTFSFTFPKDDYNV